MTISDQARIDSITLKRAGFSSNQIQDNLISWFHSHRRELPWRINWDRYQDPYHVWVSEIMLQQTLIRVVVPVYKRFLLVFPDPVTLARADEDEVRTTVRGLGYYRRFALLQKGARQLVEASGLSLSSATGANRRRPNKALLREKIRWPETWSGWKEIAGVGDYTAAAVGSICFGVSKGVVDGNVERVLCRLFDIRLPPNLPALKKRFQLLMDEMISREFPGDFNQGMMELGQHVCLSIRPVCGSCPLAGFCLARKNQALELSPAPKIRKAPQKVQMRLTIFRKGSLYGLLRRPSDARFLKSAEGFYTEIFAKRRFAWDGGVAGELVIRGRSLGKIRHSITHHKIEAEVVLLELRVEQAVPLSFRWIPRHLVERSLISNLDRKAWVLCPGA